MIYNPQSQFFQTLHLFVVVHYVAKAVKAVVASKMLLGGSNGFDNPKAESGVFIYYDRHWFSWLAASITCSYSLGVRPL